MWLTVVVLCSSAYISCANAQPVITIDIATNLRPFQLVPHRNNTYEAQSWKTKEVKTFTKTNPPHEVVKNRSADLDSSFVLKKVESHQAWEESGKIEGDMILNDQQRLLISESLEGMERNELKDITKRWPNNEVIYYINREHFSRNQVKVIEKSIDYLRRASCLKFRPYGKSDRDVVWIHGNEKGCYSDVGYQGGSQEVNLGEGCLHRGIIVHELLHTLGFYHMQSSPDRDKYVKVLWKNIVQSERYNFEKYNSDTVTDFGVGYDYYSIMHYDRQAFSANGKDTIVPKKRGVQIGQHTRWLSKKDKLKLNKMYCETSKD